MKESPRRPIILKRRKLPFQRNEAEKPPSKSSSVPGAQSVPDGICILDHPSMPDTQVVVIPKRADLQSVIDVLTVKGKEHGPQGPNKFILLSGNDKMKTEAGVEALGHGAEAAGARDAKPLLARCMCSLRFYVCVYVCVSEVGPNHSFVSLKFFHSSQDMQA